MARYSGRHRISRRTKIATIGLGLALAVGGLVITTTAGDPGQARADLADKSFFVDITKVQPNVDLPEEQEDASTGTFTVDCGKNENEHFNPDNFIAQPGVKNGAQHLHDYVGNLTTDADSNNQSLQAGGTTCKNGDKSAYFWPVVRIEDEEDVAENEQQEQQNNNQNQNDQQQNEDQNNQQDQPNDNQQDQNNQQQQNQQQQNQNDADQGDNNNQQSRDGDRRRNNFSQGNIVRAQNQNRDNDGDRRNQRQQDNEQNQQNDNNQQQQDDNQQNDNQDQNNDQDNNNNNQDNEEEQQELEGVNDQNELAGNDGEIQRPADVDLQFRGSPVGDVVAMPKFLRILYGDAKVSTNGDKNARDSWTCAGFEDRVLIDKYPICPNGAPVKRIHDFPSCWDGENIDSENHRDHIVFPNENGQCEDGFKAVPQLRITLTYNIPQEVQEKGQYKVDSFPEEEHNPASDHDDFANVMSNNIMNRLVNCINTGKTCNE